MTQRQAKPAPSSRPPDAPRPGTAGGRQWTPEQRAGIETTGCSLLLSAAAGSGKTAVLAQRCVHLVCDAAERCNIDQLLVVTFTEAAAAQMRSRIEQALRARHEHDRSPHLARQVALVEHAQVSTLHSFCARLLRQHFQVLGLDPNFVVMDADEATLLQNEIARELFADRYEQDEGGSFQRLVEAYADGNDERLLRWLIHNYHMLCSVVDPDGWRQRALHRIDEAAAMPLTSSQLGREFLSSVHSRVDALCQRCDGALKALRELGGFPKYATQLQELQVILQEWRRVLNDHGLDALAEIMQDLQLPRLPSVPSGTPNKELAKAWMDSVREEMKGGRLLESLRFASAQWQEGLRQVSPHAAVFLNLVAEFGHRYAQAKKSARSVDFADLERLALQVLRDPAKPGELAPSHVARLYHRQFQHVLVDEYQDINEVQDAILTLVSRECVCQENGVKANLFCVGDVKQSIYRFRLAEPGRFLDRHRRFRLSADDGQHGKVIDLQANFRSRGPLLEVINAVFERLMTAEAAEIHYDHTHRLRPGLPYPAHGDGGFTGAPVELHLLPADGAATADSEAPAAEGDSDAGDVELDRTQTEALLLARLIHQMMGREGGQRMQVAERGPDGALQPRPIRYSDVVILLRSLKFKADQYADILRQSGIPVHSESGSGYFQSMEVRDMLSLLGLLDNQRQDIPMAAFLRSPLAGLPQPEDSLARIRLAYRDNEAEPVPFHQAVVRYASDRKDELAAKLTDLLRDLKDWRELAHRRPLAELIWTIYERTGYLAFCAGLADAEQRCANLIHLHERARQFGTFQRQGLYRFMRFLQSLENETDLGQPSIASEAEDVVRIMSVHRSKGLEFPVVLLPDLGKRFNLQDCGGPVLVDRTACLGLSVVDEQRRIRYPSLAWTVVQDRLRRQALAEELRVLYVAMTRAKEHLVLVGTCSESTPDKWTSLWSGHRGPLPADLVLGAGCMLDWLGPTAAATRNGKEEPIRLVRHDAQEVAAWPQAQDMRPRLSPEQLRLADLKTCDPPPASTPAADAVIARLGYRYPMQPFASLLASQSITGWTKHGKVAASPPSSDGQQQQQPFERTLPAPRCTLEDARPTAVDRGTATHLVLQYLDFARPCTDIDLAEQINDLVTRKLLAPAHAAAVDFNAVAWLLTSEIGQLLRDHREKLWRELPFYYAVAPETFEGTPASSDRNDQVMIRGRIDVLVPTDEGLVLIDYKTDHVTPERLEERANSYRPQVERYRDAVEKMTGRRVTGVHLVFLTPQRVWTFR